MPLIGFRGPDWRHLYASETISHQWPSLSGLIAVRLSASLGTPWHRVHGHQRLLHSVFFSRLCRNFAVIIIFYVDMEMTGRHMQHTLSFVLRADTGRRNSDTLNRSIEKEA